MPTSRRARTATVALAWLAAVVAATAVGLTAVGAIGDGIVGAGGQPLSPAEVDAALAAARSAPPPTAAPAPAAPEPGAAPAEVVASAGGTVVARCAGGVAEIVSASPAQGFRVDSEPGEDPGRVKFESGDVEVEVRLTCRDGRPVPEIRSDTD